MNLIKLQTEFGTEEKCLEFLERMRWPNGVRCVTCGSDKISKFSTKEGTRKRKNTTTGEVESKTVPARHLYQCLEPTCKQQFTATAGTIYSNTHLPVQKWLAAIALVCNAKKGISAKQMQRDLGVTYKTAWYLNHRIREAMIGSAPAVFEGTVEADATFVGGKFDKRRKRAKYGKQAVFGLVQRKSETGHSKVYAQPVPIETRPVVRGIIEDRVSETATVYTDEHPAYRFLRKTDRPHAIVIHSRGQYVDGTVHNNSVENFWSLFKRGLIGSFHQVSVKHLSRYLAEFTFRFNNREAENMFGMVVINLLAGIALEYKRLISPPSPITSFAELLPSGDEPS
ncbi:MAG: IS1595 family transposase [Acidobacteriia bacterium]|nr:IS1595 family transposase [Terriglobia bacterium]